MIVGIATDKYGPQDLAEGETVIWNKQTGCRIKLDENGKITIDAPAGQDVMVNGGSEKVARTNDTLTASGAFLTWAAAVDAGIPTNTPPATPFAAAAGLAGGMGDIETGAARFKA
jgi:phage gp45-like